MSNISIPVPSVTVADTTLLAQMPDADVVAYLQGKGYTVTAAPAAPPPAAPAATPPASSSSTPATPSGPALGTLKLAFEDTFDGPALDATKWAPSWFSGGSMNGVTTTPANVAVTAGNLVLTLSDASHGALVSTNPNGGAKTGFQFTTGIVEARIKFPDNGTAHVCWPAWWTDGQSWPANGEIDIAEILGGNVTGHYISSAGNPSLYNAGYQPGWHIYTMQRTPTQVQVWIDGVLKATHVGSDFATSPHYLILNIGQGQGSATVAGSQLLVDYVRAWT